VHNFPKFPVYAVFWMQSRSSPTLRTKENGTKADPFHSNTSWQMAECFERQVLI